MNILFEIFSFNVGGIERQLVDMCNLLAQDPANRIWLCVINDDYTESLLKTLSPEVQVLLLHRPAGTQKNLPYMRKLASFVRQNRIDIIHCQGVNCVLFSALTKLRHPAPVIINTVHDSGNYPSYSAGTVFLVNRFVDHTIAISRSVRQEILSRRVRADKVSVVENAVDCSRFHYVDRSQGRGYSSPGRIVADEKSNVPSEDCKNAYTEIITPAVSGHGSKVYTPLAQRPRIELINIARFQPAKKGQDLLIDALEMLVPAWPAIHVTFAGEAHNDQQEELRKLQDRIHSAHLEEHVTFLGNVDDVPAQLASGDIFVLPSRYEGFGIALVEALSTGMPSVASGLQGPAEILSHPGLGLLFNPGDAADLAAKIDIMIRNYESYDRRKISDYISQTYDIHAQVQRHLDLYRQLLNN